MNSNLHFRIGPTLSLGLVSHTAVLDTRAFLRLSVPCGGLCEAVWVDGVVNRMDDGCRTAVGCEGSEGLELGMGWDGMDKGMRRG